MTAYVEIKKYASADGLRELTIEKGEHGLFRYVTWKWYDPAPELPQIAACWTPDSWSGLYATLDEAEGDALAAVGWVHE